MKTMKVMKARFWLPVLGRQSIGDHIEDILVIGAVLAAAYFLVFIPLSYYIGLGVDIAEGAAHTLNK